MNWLVYRITDSPLMLGLVSFDRLLGRLFIGTEDVSDIMVRHGLASATKPEATRA